MRHPTSSLLCGLLLLAAPALATPYTITGDQITGRVEMGDVRPAGPNLFTFAVTDLRLTAPALAAVSTAPGTASYLTVAWEFDWSVRALSNGVPVEISGGCRTTWPPACAGMTLHVGETDLVVDLVPVPVCAGDLNGDGVVTVDELVRAVGVALAGVCN